MKQHSSENQQIKKQNAQVKALFLKNAQLQSKQPCTNICQIMTPVICLIFTYLIKTIAENQLPNGAIYSDNTFPYVFSNSKLIDTNSWKVNSKTSLPILNTPSRDNPLQWYLYECINNCPSSTLLGNYDGTTPQATSNGSTLLGSVLNDVTQFSIPSVTLDYYNNPLNSSTRFIPFFIQTQKINNDLFNRIDTSQENDFQAIKSGRKGLDTIPDGGVSIHDITTTKLNMTLRINDIRDLDLHRNNGVSNLVQSHQIKDTNFWAGGITDIISPYGMLKLQDLMTQAYGYLVSTKAGKSMNYQSGYIFTRDTESAQSFVNNIINTISALIFPIALSLLFPVMLYGLVLQKEQRLVQMMKMNGMKIYNYWLVYFIFNFLLCTVTNLIFFLLGAFVLKTPFFTQTSAALLIIIAIGWSISQIGMAAFFQTFLSKAQSANIIGYVIAIWTMMISSTLNVGVYQVPSEFPGWLQALPPSAFNRLFYLMLSECSDAHCYGSINLINSEMKNCIVALYMGGIILLLLGSYLLEILPQQFGVNRSPLFPFIDFYRFITCKEKLTYLRPEKDKQLKRYMTESEQDPLSRAERETVSKLTELNRAPLIINNLRKLYQKQGYVGPYPAVKSFNLQIEQRESFGLLGPNGAGKTTLISMLTGMITPDYGNAWIGGYDINSNISRAQLQMGVCPQFDLVWPQLTVQEHLRFYARLKGIPGSELQTKINQAIEEVNLTKFKTFLASSLSGGMKRRLSIAISLVGNPKIVFLDEPTTGLDPDNRRQIWQVLAKCQERRALFLTTHMMEQAEALCHRIGIITHGTLRTLGSELKLKKTYGEGYRLSMSLSSQEKKLVSPETLNIYSQNKNINKVEENQEDLRKSIHDMIEKDHQSEKYRTEKGIMRLQDYVLKTFPGSVKMRTLGTSLVFKIPASFKISDIFIEMHNVEHKLEVANIAVTESSLEDVFISVVLKYDKIIDDQETGQPRLMQRSHDNEYISQEEQLSKNVAIQNKLKPKDSGSKYGSILQKNRVSEFSEQEKFGKK